MTSLFSHSLLNDTDRDVRGAYRAFSRKTVHAPCWAETKTTDRQQIFSRRGEIMPWLQKKWLKHKVSKRHFVISAIICL